MKMEQLLKLLHFVFYMGSCSLKFILKNYLQIYHIHKLNPAIVHWMVVVIDEKILHSVGLAKSAFLIKFYDFRTFPCSNLQNMIIIFILFYDKVNKSAAKTLFLALWVYRNIFYFQNPVAFIGYNTYCDGLVIRQGVHSASLQIKINHIFLFISQ